MQTGENQDKNIVEDEQDLCEQLLDLCKNSDYEIIQFNGQRIYSIKNAKNIPTPPRGCEIFIGSLSRNVFESEIVPVFAKIGKLFNFRLMVDLRGLSRGYGFATYFELGDANRAIKLLNGYKFNGIAVEVCKSLDNCQLYFGNIPQNKTKQDVFEMLQRLCEGVIDVILPPSHENSQLNKGFAFVEFADHYLASRARRDCVSQYIGGWDKPLYVDWADPLPDVDPLTMAQVC